MTLDIFEEALTAFETTCRKINFENKLKDPTSTIKYEVLQLSEMAKNPECIYNIVRFYNENWTGNKDFIHIPDLRMVMENCMKYPIIVAHEEGKEEILGISTVKYFENDDTNIDPYFPEKNAKYFSITGILTKKDSPYHGIGKRIYEAAIRGTHEYKKKKPDTRLMLVIDCRNYHSVNGLKSALRYIKRKKVIGIDKEFISNIIGYYELRDKKTNELLEAPTIVIEIDLEPKDINDALMENVTMQFEKKTGKELFKTILEELRNWLGNLELRTVIEDEGWGIVSFFSVLDKAKTEIDKITILPDGTTRGNQRTIEDLSYMMQYQNILPLVYAGKEKVLKNEK